ncbi:MAG: cytochrome b/b6 domain-containing protein [Gammaproteobacteria bacterium]|nr:cytochrome b/b6 domain-containing protein [Gammaproteobacteria bacterium]MCP5135648.1 cytochrome b/b6 domain-containing protein [Gammaproteobacteria bacterium]
MTMVRVWDPLVRVFHWSLALTFAAAWLTGEDESALHDVFGYAILALIGVRLIWGLLGTRYARFSDFVRGPATVLAYLQDIARSRAQRHLGHNPAGGAMVVALLLSLIATALTGMGLEGVQSGTGLFANLHDLGHDAEEWFEELHELFANFSIFLVFVHVAGVLLASFQHGENLVRAMITGRKRAAD